MRLGAILWLNELLAIFRYVNKTLVFREVPFLIYNGFCPFNPQSNIKIKCETSPHLKLALRSPGLGL